MLVGSDSRDIISGFIGTCDYKYHCGRTALIYTEAYPLCLKNKLVLKTTHLRTTATNYRVYRGRGSIF